MRNALAFALAAATPWLAACGGAVEARSPVLDPEDVALAVGRTRNVVVFLIDTLRADHLGCYGYARDTSPHLDAVARDGIVFEDCLAQSSWTKPSTAAVLTGEPPSRHGATQADARIADGIATLAERLSAAGVATGAVVANGWISREMGFARGFDAFETPTLEDCDRMVDRALEWVRGRGEDPFFLYVHVIDPHDPYQPPPPFDRLFDPGYDGAVTGAEDGPELQALRGADLEHLIALYDGEIAYTDRAIGRFVRELERDGRLEDTALLFVADHGEAFDEHGSFKHNPLLYREVVRVPLVLAVPGGEALRGLRHPGLVQQIDVAPTVMHLFDLEPDPALPGRSLLTLVARPDARPHDSLAICEVDFNGALRTAVVGGGLKYVRQVAPRPEELLFDLRRDPGELENLLPEGEPAARRHARFLDAYQRATSSGYSLLVQNELLEALTVRVFLACASAPPPARIFNAEWGLDGRDGPIETAEVTLGGRRLHVTIVRLDVGTGNSDGVVFEPPEGGEVLIAAQVDGRWAGKERFLLGRSLPAPEMPIRIRADGGLDAPRFPAREDLGGEPYRFRIWRNASARTDDGEIGEEARAALRAMGYFGDEE